MSAIASSGRHRNSDGVYRAVDIYLDNHRFLTEHEKEEACKVLDCPKLSREAFEHAARNERLPMRIVVQVLFEVQLQMRDTINKDAQGFAEKLKRKGVNEEDYDTGGSYAEEGVITELERMKRIGEGMLCHQERDFEQLQGEQDDESESHHLERGEEKVGLHDGHQQLQFSGQEEEEDTQDILASFLKLD